MTVRERIESLCQVLGITKAELAKSVKRDPGVISHAIKDNRFPRGFIADVCLSFPEINPQFLASGKGSVLRPERDVEKAVKEKMIKLILESLDKMEPEVRSLLIEAFKRVDQ